MASMLLSIQGSSRWMSPQHDLPFPTRNLGNIPVAGVNDRILLAIISSRYNTDRSAAEKA